MKYISSYISFVVLLSCLPVLSMELTTTETKNNIPTSQDPQSPDPLTQSVFLVSKLQEIRKDTERFTKEQEERMKQSAVIMEAIKQRLQGKKESHGFLANQIVEHVKKIENLEKEHAAQIKLLEDKFTTEKNLITQKKSFLETELTKTEQEIDNLETKLTQPNSAPSSSSWFGWLFRK